MKSIKITRAGCYDPKLGPKHPDNQDPTLVQSILNGDKLTRVVDAINADGWSVTVVEEDDDRNVVTVISDKGGASVTIDATQLWKLAGGIASLFGGVVLNLDQQRTRNLALREKLFDVLERNESRCLDDNVDRDVVLRELLKALS